jgi:hypothetical protein
MTTEREQVFKLHDLLCKKREQIQTTFSPLTLPNESDHQQPGRGIDYGRLSGIISGSGKINGDTRPS